MPAWISSDHVLRPENEIVEMFKSDVIRRHITNTFISMMENGELPPWQRPWRVPRQISVATGKPYRGINAYHLASIAAREGYHSSHWLTADRAEGDGHRVRSGERGTIIIAVKVNDGADDTNNSDESRPLPPVSVFHHTVFNLNQCVGMERAGQETTILPEAQSVIKKYVNREQRLIPKTLKFSERGTRAYYTPSEDSIVVPPRSMYSDIAEYYMTVFHEVAHSTGHHKRLDRRDRDKPDGPHDYGQEELVAEMTASILSAETDLEFNGAWVKNTASYLNGWLRVIRGDPNMLIWASLQATTAVEYILDRDGARREARKRADKRERERNRKSKARARKKR